VHLFAPSLFKGEIIKQGEKTGGKVNKITLTGVSTITFSSARPSVASLEEGGITYHNRSRIPLL